jgi:hypothetical protein
MAYKNKEKWNTTEKQIQITDLNKAKHNRQQQTAGDIIHHSDLSTIVW